MTFLRHRGRRIDPSPAIVPPSASPAASPAVSPAVSHGGVVVLLSPELADLALPLGLALGPGFVIQTEGPGADGVMIVGPVGPTSVAFLRASHPGAVLLVVDRSSRGSSSAEAVLHLEAGVDGYLAGPVVAEVASHVRALARRAAA